LNLPGPVAAARLAGLGAVVVKVEPPSGDPLGGVAPGWYGELARGQDVRFIDLKDEVGRRQLDALLEEADLLLTSFRPSALDVLGLAWPQLTRRFPRLCQVAIVGHAAQDQERPGHDLTYQASSGLLPTPTVPRVPLADLAGAERAVTEGLAALVKRAATGASSYCEVSLADVCDHFAEPVRRGLTTPDGVLGGGSPRYGIYEASTGYVALAALEPHFWRRLLTLLEADGSRESLESAFTRRTALEWEEWAQAHDMPLVAVQLSPTSQPDGLVNRPATVRRGPRSTSQ
jgi:crotonobetainyl-CoA:carnitine CoA-transferase CaiB-like acyl-CoA transferase